YRRRAALGRSAHAAPPVALCCRVLSWTHPMKRFGLALLVCLAPVWAQPLPNLPDEKVVAIFSDGVKLTMGEFKRLLAALPPENQQQAAQNRAQFLQQWGMMRKLAQLAESEKLDQVSPAKESLEYN